MRKHPDRSTDIYSLGILECLSPQTKQLVNNLEGKTYAHCCRVSLLARSFGNFLQLSSQETRTLVIGAYFHDIGKAYIPESILNKPESLTHEEWKIIKAHPAIDKTILDFSPELGAIMPIIQYHHEHWDGSGYPYGLVREEIPYLARVIQMLDIYDALIHRRSYKPVFSSEKAIAIIQKESVRGWYQPLLVEQIVEFIRFSQRDTGKSMLGIGKGVEQKVG
jgi:putative two-component system response regulator